MPENRSNSIQTSVESADRPPPKGRSNALAAFIFAEAVLASPIALAAGAAIFQFISSGEISPETDFWLRFAVLGLGGTMIFLAGLHSETLRD